MLKAGRAVVLILAALGPLACGERQRGQPSVADHVLARRDQESSTEFARLIDRLSERGRYFDTDNLITNESSYLHVMGKLAELGVTGGGYIGVGPEQNFSYVAQVKPSIAFMIDIRRDNLLHHLLHKALFEIAENRIQYLCLWLGRPFPDGDSLAQASLPQMVEYIDRARTSAVAAVQARTRVRDKILTFGLQFSAEDFATIDRFHQTFIAEGLSLRFRSHGRPPSPEYPTLRQLLLETDLEGNLAHYLSSDEGFDLLKTMQENDLIVPVVGDLAGDHALAEIGDYLRERRERVSVVYTSNVEYYLVRDGGLDTFIDNLRRLPRDESTVIIRSYFNNGASTEHPQQVTGYASAQLLQNVDSLIAEYAAGRVRSYWDLVTKQAIALRESAPSVSK